MDAPDPTSGTPAGTPAHPPAVAPGAALAPPLPHALPTGVTLAVRTAGDAALPPLLLLHGFPQTSAMWRRVAQALSARFFCVMPDLRGYGASTLPADEPVHAQAAKRAMASDVHALMASLGHARYAVCGHDRGGRVAHRLALDRPEAVTKLCVIDIAPTLDMYAATDMAFARAYYHWFHLIQPAPLPETMIGGCAPAYLRAKLGGWGAAGTAHVEPAALAEYEAAFCRPEAIHAACEDYRASAGIDLEHDRASRAAGERIACPLHVVWGARGIVHRLFDPMALWRAQAAGAVGGVALDAGHFIPEERPGETAAELLRFFGD